MNSAAHFHCFGYAIERNILDVPRLEAAYTRCIQKAPRYDYFGTNGTHCLLNCVEHDAEIASMMDSPKIQERMIAIWDRPLLYVGGSDLWLNKDDVPWHTDGLPGRRVGVIKAAAYLDPQPAGEGSLNLIPGSHLPEFSRTLFDCIGFADKGRPRLRLQGSDYPWALSLPTQPGDLVFFDTRLWHSAYRRPDGQPRRSIFISFLPDPADISDGIQAVRVSVKAHLGEQRVLFPPQMLDGATAERQEMIARLRALGVERLT